MLILHTAISMHLFCLLERCSLISFFRSGQLNHVNGQLHCKTICCYQVLYQLVSLNKAQHQFSTLPTKSSISLCCWHGTLQTLTMLFHIFSELRERRMSISQGVSSLHEPPLTRLTGVANI